MSLVSQDGDKGQEYMFVNDKLQGKSNIIHGMPVIFCTRVIDDSRNLRAEEVFRRFVNITPNSTKEKIKEANRIISKRYGLLPEEYNDQIVSNDDKQRAIEKVGYMVEHLKKHTEHLKPKESSIRILFEETLSHTMPYDDVFQMTVFDMLARYLTIITKVKMCSRARFVHNTIHAFYPIPTFNDLKQAFGLMETGGSNVRPYLAEMYNEVIFPLYSKIKEPRVDKDGYGNILASEEMKGLKVREITDGAKQTLDLTISTKDIYGKYLTPMVEFGLINWTKSLISGREKIYYPVDEEATRVHYLFPDDDMRLIVRDKYFYPSKDVLEQSYGSRSKQSCNEGGKKNIFDIYKLEDHEGKEITVSELIDRYLSNPEICFKKGWILPPYYSEGPFPVRVKPKPEPELEPEPQDYVLSNLITSKPPSRPNLLT